MLKNSLRNLIVLLLVCGLTDPLHAADIDRLIDIRSDHDVRDAAAIKTELNVLHEQLQRDLKVPPLRDEVALYLFADAAAYRDFLKTSVPGVRPTFRPALFLLRNGKPYIFTYRQPNLMRSLRHEFTHAVLNASHPGLPIWLDEGLAEYYENSGRINRLHRRTIERRDGVFFWKPSLKRMERLRTMSQMQSLEYAETWAWVHFFQQGPRELRQTIPEFLADLRGQENQPVRPLSARVADTRIDAVSEFRSHHRRGVAANKKGNKKGTGTKVGPLIIR